METADLPLVLHQATYLNSLIKAVRCEVSSLYVSLAVSNHVHCYCGFLAIDAVVLALPKIHLDQAWVT